ncbi:hypothetical protein CLU79DRAFT_522639 [Phycomyces nitens]|nr:hypothetical protein CLU79DRAFT_522639 [Phycomyces nitens]
MNNRTINCAVSEMMDEAIAEFNTIFSIGKEFESISHLREAAQEYGNKYDIVFTTESSKKAQIKMICKHAGQYREKREKGEKESSPEAQRKSIYKDSQKIGCPCFIYARKNRLGWVTVRKQEAGHSHLVRPQKSYSGHRTRGLDSMFNTIEANQSSIGVTNGRGIMGAPINHITSVVSLGHQSPKDSLVNTPESLNTEHLKETKWYAKMPDCARELKKMPMLPIVLCL